MLLLNLQYDHIWGIDEELQKVNDKNGWQVGIHVDGASGGFVAPFQEAAGSKIKPFDFRLPNVLSMSGSGHGGEKGVKSGKGHGGKVSSKGSRHASSSPSLRPTKKSKEMMILKSKKHKGGENESSKGKGEVSPKGGNSKSKSKGKGKGAVSSKSKTKGSKREGPQSKGAKGKGESRKSKVSGSKIKGSKTKGSKTGKKIHGSAGKPAASPLKLVVPTLSKSPTISGGTTDSSSASDCK